MRFSEIENHLKRFRVGIAGAGGLGSNCAAALARCGIGSLVIADFDSVEESNLSRQFYFTSQIGMMKTVALKENLFRIRSDIEIITHEEILDEKNVPLVFKNCSVIVEAFDKAEMKEMLIETVQMKMPGIPLVVASGLAGWGKNEIIRYRKIDETLYLCGDEKYEATDDLPPLAPRVGIVANMQANAVIEILLGKMQ
jgi:sulfur carrier protein ThiS adenylyltransferase